MDEIIREMGHSIITLVLGGAFIGMLGMILLLISV